MTTPDPNTVNSPAVTDAAGAHVSGKKIVIAMFSMGILSTSLLWFYWDLHLQPFMPLQEALAVKFEKSSPRVDGGQRKSHKGTPRVLRVVMRVPFDPNGTSEDEQSAIEGRISGTHELAKNFAAIEEYDLLEVHLFQEEKEQSISQKTFARDISATSSPRS